MLRFKLNPVTTAATALSALLPVSAFALPSCADLGSDPAYGLVGNPVFSSVSSTQVAATSDTPTYCQVDLTLSTPGMSGPAAGYDLGQSQAIRMRFVLPEKSEWNGKYMPSTGPGSQGQNTSNWGFIAGINGGAAFSYAIQRGYISSTTDAGHLSSENFAVIQSTHKPNVGKLSDWTLRASTETTQWGKNIAAIYYGSRPTRTYWNGCSGAGLQGMTQAQLNASEYDGFLIGAPAIYWQYWQQGSAWPPVVIKDMLTSIGKTLTSGQVAAANQAAIAACDAADGVTDGIITDPRVCTFSAKANMCGAPGAPAAPNCLDSDQAAAIDKIWDGPRNALGARVWFPWDRGVNFSVNPPASIQIFGWDHSDTSFDWRNVTIQNFADEVLLGSNSYGDLINTQDPTLEGVKAWGGKIIWLHGTADATIPWRQSLDYYRRVASINGATDYAGLQSWFRLFPMPGVGHCIVGFGGVTLGPGATDPFDALVNWVEHGVAPDTILASGGAVPTRTRPLCPYPTTAIYNGSGSTDVATNFHCGGNLETPQALCTQYRTKYKHETFYGERTCM